MLAEINSEERKLATEQTVFVSPQSAKKKNSADTVAESLHELRDAAEKIRKEVEEVDAQLIRRFKVGMHSVLDVCAYCDLLVYVVENANDMLIFAVAHSLKLNLLCRWRMALPRSN